MAIISININTIMSALRISQSLIFILFFLLATGCKKCIHCENVCYYCQGVVSPTVCSTQFAKESEFAEAIAGLQAQGITCTSIAATRAYDICDDPQSAKNFKYLLTTQNYVCE